MFKGLFWYFIIGAIILGLSQLCIAGSDTASFEWSPNSDDPDGYSVYWGYDKKDYLAKSDVPAPLHIVDGKIRHTVTNLPDETIYFAVVAWAKNPEGHCYPSRSYSKPSFEITRYVGPYITPGIPQGVTLEELLNNEI